MRRWVPVLLVAMACRSHPVPSGADAGPRRETAASVRDAGVEFSLAKLDAFLGYERALRAGQPPSTAELRRASRAVDGGARALEEAYARLKRQAEREHALRADAGLTAAEVQALESLTAEVALARAGSGGREMAQALEELSAAKDQLPPDQRAAVERTLERLRSVEERSRTLSEVRAAWGDGPVDLVLQREKGVLELWSPSER
jgi:hypothetical protein